MMLKSILVFHNVQIEKVSVFPRLFLLKTVNVSGLHFPLDFHCIPTKPFIGLQANKSTSQENAEKGIPLRHLQHVQKDSGRNGPH